LLVIRALKRPKSKQTGLGHWDAGIMAGTSSGHALRSVVD
jgi:hypothetical protein